jgi:hypothetical protein
MFMLFSGKGSRSQNSEVEQLQTNGGPFVRPLVIWCGCAGVLISILIAADPYIR